MAFLCLLVVSSLSNSEPPRTGAPGSLESKALAATDWPWWRGPNRNGVAAAGQTPLLHWSDRDNVIWKSPVPGRGHGSPTIVGDQVFLATAEEDKQIQAVLCFDRRTGGQRWRADIHQGGFEQKGNAKSSMASSTPACDGERVFINFLHKDAIYTTALNREGKQLWQTKITGYVLHQGFASSPAIYGPFVIVTADNKGGGVIAGLDRATGQVVWKQARPALPNYASPIILHITGKDQLIITGCDLVTSLHPLTGEKLWEVRGATTECVTSTVTDGKLIFTSGGYPKNHVSAVHADGLNKLAWEKAFRIYVPSMLVHQGCLYGIGDAGTLTCWHCETGKEAWKDRLEGNFSSSPVLVGEHVFATNEAGRTFIFKATPKQLEVVAENQLGQEVLATPSVCGSRIYMRVALQVRGQRQEMLYCLGEK